MLDVKKQTLETVFHHISKHWEESWKFEVFGFDETLSRVFHYLIYYFSWQNFAPWFKKRKQYTRTLILRLRVGVKLFFKTQFKASLFVGLITVSNAIWQVSEMSKKHHLYGYSVVTNVTQLYFRKGNLLPKFVACIRTRKHLVVSWIFYTFLWLCTFVAVNYREM